jgi:GT2 family glycosyltransferase
MQPTLSYLIIAWNGWRHLRTCLASIRRSGVDDCEVVVFDNGSQDGSVELVRQQFPEVSVYANSVNLGHTGGFNQGIKLLRGRYVLLLDTDTELAPDTAQSLLDFLEERPDVALVAPRVYCPDGSIQETARNFPSAASGLFGRQSVLSRRFPNNPFSRRYLARDKLDSTEPYQVQSVSSACTMFRRELIDETGLWDERYPGYWVDIDWCHRIWDMGKPVYCLPGSSVTHFDNYGRERRKTPGRIWMFHWGAYMLYRKYYTFGKYDPRAMLAFVALAARAGIMIAWNELTPVPAARDVTADRTGPR